MKPIGRKYNMKERREEIEQARASGNWSNIPPVLQIASKEGDSKEK